MTGCISTVMSDRETETDVPGLTIGISGPARRSMAHRLISLGLRLHGARTHYIRPGDRTNVELLDGLVLSGGQIASADQIDTMITAAVLNAERFYPAMQLLVWGDRTPHEALQIAIAEAYGRA